MANAAIHEGDTWRAQDTTAWVVCRGITRTRQQVASSKSPVSLSDLALILVAGEKQSPSAQSASPPFRSATLSPKVNRQVHDLSTFTFTFRSLASRNESTTHQAPTAIQFLACSPCAIHPILFSRPWLSEQSINVLVRRRCSHATAVGAEALKVHRAA